MPLTLYIDMMSQPSRSVLIFCLENKIPHNVKLIQIAKGGTRDPAFAAVNPAKKVPVIDDDGFVLWESHAILKYLATTRKTPDHWYPSDPLQRARVDRYLDWHHSGLRSGAAGEMMAQLFGPKLGMNPESLAHMAKTAKKTLVDSLQLMENFFLKDQPFLTGNQISIADLLAANEISMFALLPAAKRPSLPTVVRAWYSRAVQALPSWDTAHSVVHKLAGQGATRQLGDQAQPQPQPQPQQAQAKAEAKAATPAPSSNFKTAVVLQVLEEALKTEAAAIVKQTGAVFAVVVRSGKEVASWTLDFKHEGKIYQGVNDAAHPAIPKPDVRFNMTDDDFVALCAGSLNAQQAFISGKLKISGSLQTALKFQSGVFASRQQQIRDAVKGLKSKL